MKSGMLWHDNSESSLYDKLLKAFKAYEKKYGSMPNRAYMNVHEFKENLEESEATQVRLRENDILLDTKQTIMPSNYWIGRADAETEILRKNTFTLVGKSEKDE